MVLRFATDLPSRLKGLLGGQACEGELFIAPCRDIHTLGMRYDIDVAFLGKKGEVVKAVRNVGPGRRIRCKSACAVLEHKADEDLDWYREGQRLMMLPLA